MAIRTLYFSLAVIWLLNFCGCGSGTNDSSSTPDEKKIEPKNFVFVGADNDNAGLFEYDFKSREISEFWLSKGESVVYFNYSDDKSRAYFITASEFGKRGLFPFIKNARLYLMDSNSMVVRFITDLGSGIQLYSSWEGESTLKITLNAFDRTSAAHINQKTMIFSITGKLLLEEDKTFDLTKESYPKPASKEINFVSSDGKYGLEIESRNKFYKLTLVNLQKKRKNFLIEGTKKVNQVEWKTENDLLIFSALHRNDALNVNESEKADLYIVSLSSAEVKRKWSSGRIKNFMLEGNLLIFDDGIGENSVINIYDIKADKLIDRLSLSRGCRLMSVPKIPNYET